MMTERRVRHVPVVADGGLRGIVSIGDIGKNRSDELETERTALRLHPRKLLAVATRSCRSRSAGPSPSRAIRR